MPESIKVCCLGAGYFSGFHYDAWSRIKRAALVGACDTRLERAAGSGVSAYTDLSLMLQEQQPDLLDIITPPVTHAEAIDTAIACNIPTIVCQKPFCSSLQEARRVTQTAKDNGVALIVHENFRFQPWFRAAASAISEGLVGNVQQATFRLRTGDGQGPDAYLDRQPYFQTMQRLLIHETGVHYIDTFRYLFGEPVAVYAELKKRNPVIAGEDAALVVFDFPDQVQAVLDGNRHLDMAAANTRLTFGEALFEGSEGTLQLHGDGKLTHRKFGKVEHTTLLAATDWPGFAGDCVYALQNHVVEHLLEGGKLENTAEQYLGTLELEQAVYRSSEQRRKLDLI